MDFLLRCNSLKCRAQLDDRAVVTTCSHIFCVPCSESLGLSNPDSNTRTCPACATNLANPDDAVVTQLNPSEDYKTSVLSGLSPSVIMECAGRGLSFHSYQTTQEMQESSIYQEFLARSLTDKYSHLSSQMDQVIVDANTEIKSLREKLEVMHREQKNLEQKNRDLAGKFKEKAKAQQTLQRLYQSLKAQQLAAGMELAAEHDAEYVLQAAGHATHSDGARRAGQPPMQSRAGSNGSGSRSRTIDAWRNQTHSTRAGHQSSHSAPIPSTPSGHRARLPLGGNHGTAMSGSGIGADTLRHGTPYRPVFGNLDPNVYGHVNNAGYGMSAGIKVGRQPDGPLNRSGYDVGRSTSVGGYHAR